MGLLPTSTAPLRDSVRVARKLHAPYWVGRCLFCRRLARQTAEGSQQIIVYQMGKVGSSTVVRSIRTASSDVLVHQVHTLTDQGMARLNDIFRESWPRGNPLHLWRSEFLRQELDSASSHGPWKVITLVRDPIAKNVSSFFQVADLEFNCDLAGLAHLGDEVEIAAEVQRLFLDVFDQHDRPLVWFDRELGQIFRFDVLSRPFPHRDGWLRCTRSDLDLLILRLEDLNRVGGLALGDFLGKPEIHVVSANTTLNKAHASVYTAFLRNARLPDWYVEHMYSSRYARHFYTESEREAFAKRWQDK